jgi:hypothetical protein
MDLNWRICMYLYDLKTADCKDLNKYKIEAEYSMQQQLSENPQILLSSPDLALSPYESIIAFREYPTNRGPIDILYITDNGDIIIVETKLLKNPESHRTVVAQAIDYAKSFTEETVDMIKNKMRKKNLDYSLFDKNISFESILDKNIRNGNYSILIVGDEIHPNILGMVESIQAAPHLAFTVYAMSLNPYETENEKIIFYPKIESKTLEIERSVISIEIINNEVKIDSSSPEKDRKGNKPIISEEEYINNLEVAEFLGPIKFLWNEIKNMGGSINWGVVGFSGGYRLNNKRISLIWVYDKKFNLLSRKVRNTYNVTDQQYNTYLDKLKESEFIYENVVVPNKSEVNFKDIEKEDFKIAITAMLWLMKDMMTNEEKYI